MGLLCQSQGPEMSHFLLHSRCPLSYLHLTSLMSKISKNLNCYVTFHSIHCVFQNNLTKTTIGIVKERGGLYYLEGTRELQPKFDRILQVTKETSDREKILL